MSQQSWNSTLYDRHYAFVWQYGESLIDWLAPQSGEKILDLGCGTGHLTAKMAATGAIVSGIDADPSMIATAQQTYPYLSFTIADARDFRVVDPLDAVFSNATLHWIQEADAVIRCLDQALKPGGRLAIEMGGQGNVQALLTALFAVLKQRGYGDCESWNPWYFPSISDYTSRLERQGFEVTQAILFDRPTALEDGEAGIRNWFHMFGHGILSRIPPENHQPIMQAVEAQLQPSLYRNHQWIADYRRLRIAARKL